RRRHLHPFPPRRPPDLDIFATAMTATTRATEEAVLSHHNFGYFERVVDIGGSHASLVGRLLERYPEARGAVFDLPDTVEAGRRRDRKSTRLNSSHVKIS